MCLGQREGRVQETRRIRRDHRVLWGDSGLTLSGMGTEKSQRMADPSAKHTQCPLNIII